MFNLQIAEKDGGWSVLREGEPVTIDGRTSYADRDDLEALIERRGLFIHSDGTLHRTPDIPALRREEPEPSYTPEPAPATEDPPVDPNAQPDDPDPNPTVPVKEPKTPKKASGKVKITADAKAIAEGIAQARTSLSGNVPRRRGRPPKSEGKISEEEKRRARAEYARKYRAQMSPEQRDAAKERAKDRQKKWREAHPEQAAQYARQSSIRRKERYNEDEEFHSNYREYQREYARTKDLTT